MYVGVDLVKAERWERICEKFPSRLEKCLRKKNGHIVRQKGKVRLILTRRSGRQGKRQEKHWG